MLEFHLWLSFTRGGLGSLNTSINNDLNVADNGSLKTPSYKILHFK